MMMTGQWRWRWPGAHRNGFTNCMSCGLTPWRYQGRKEASFVAKLIYAFLYAVPDWELKEDGWEERRSYRLDALIRKVGVVVIRRQQLTSHPWGPDTHLSAQELPHVYLTLYFVTMSTVTPTCLCPEPDKFNLHHLLLLEINFNIISHLTLLFRSSFPPTPYTCLNFSYMRATCPTHLVLNLITGTMFVV